MHSDQGPEFRLDLKNKQAHLLGIKATKTAPCHPRSDGHVERFNRTLIAMLSKLCEDCKEDWDDHLPYVMCAYRATINESTGYSPNRMMLGRETTLPIDLVFPSAASIQPFQCEVEYVEWVQAAMQQNYERAREHLGMAAARQKSYFDARARGRKFKAGDWVLRLCVPNINQDKMNFPYVGPYLVVKEIGEVNYLIQRNSKAIPFTVHVDDLKLYQGKDTPKSWLPMDGSNPTDRGVQCELSISQEGEPQVVDPDLGRLLGPALSEGCEQEEEQDQATSGEGQLLDQRNGTEGSQDHDLGVVEQDDRERIGKRVRRPPKRFGWD